MTFSTHHAFWLVPVVWVLVLLSAPKYITSELVGDIILVLLVLFSIVIAELSGITKIPEQGAAHENQH